ncbi:hypothetical protein DKX38_006923 [Salix brachista]|uniref:Uncharacterized protein n=1 Tax=Salix brachista TaxID=2182728 RepID=A0A5N5MLR4_9ROSI|nr:hypothetical protein DKX38_006923 [Salix brachista]
MARAPGKHGRDQALDWELLKDIDKKMKKSQASDLVVQFNPTFFSSPNDIVRPENLPAANFSDATTSTPTEFHSQASSFLQVGHGHREVTGSDMYDAIKTQIVNHPRYPDLVSAPFRVPKGLSSSSHSL